MSRRVGIVVPRPVPAVRGGAERHWDAVARALTEAGHRPEIVGLDSPEGSMRELLASYRAFRSLDVSRFDTILTGKYPAWMVDHPDHVVHMLHPLRGVYEQYPPVLGAITDLGDGANLENDLHAAADAGPDALLDWVEGLTDGLDDDHPLMRYPGPLIRGVVHALDTWALDPSRIRAHGALSRAVADRPGYFPSGAAVEVIPAESDLPTAVGRQPIPAFVTASRLDRPKRLDLLIDGFRAAGLPDAQLWIAGSGPDETRLKAHAAGDHRIRFLGRVSDTRLAELYADAVAVPFVPHDEDFGLIALEAMRAGRPVITCDDSGGVAEQIEHGETGLVVPPHAPYLGEAFRALWLDRVAASAMGRAGRRRAARVNLDALVRWVDEAPTNGAERTPPHIVIVSTFAIEPMVGGGQRRLRELARRLRPDARVTVVALAGAAVGDGRPRRRRLDDGIVEVVVPRTAAHLDADGRLGELADLAVDDIAIARLHEASPAFAETLAAELGDAAVIVLSHPFLSTALPDDLDTPVVYDAHNAETDLKDALLGPSPIREWLVGTCGYAERRAVERAAVVSHTTPSDATALARLAPGATPAWLEVPNGVDTDVLTLRTDLDRRAARAELLQQYGYGDDGQPIAVFVGSWHLPNIDAGTAIIELARERRDVLFVLAGGHTKSVPSATPNVLTIDTFPESTRRRLLTAADVALNPMTTGSGTNLKVLDYLAVGVPVISTPLGARGLDEPDRVVWQADIPAFGETIDRVLTDPITAAERIAAGRKLVETDFAWDVVGGRWADALFALLDPPPDRSLPSRPGPRAQEATMTDPFQDLVLTTMWEGARRARGEPPMSGTHPSILDRKIADMIAWAERHSKAGQEIPDEARLGGPKKALVRVGKIISNEQRMFNDAVVEVLKRLDDRTKGQAERAFDEARAHRIEERLSRTIASLDGLDGRLAALEQSVTELRANHVDPLETSRNEQAHRLQTVMEDLVVTGRELDRTKRELAEQRVLFSAGAHAAAPATPAPAPVAHSRVDLDGFYEDLEDVFRGDPAVVRATQLEHADRLAELAGGEAPVIDVGCGRGEWLSILAERGIPAVGVDMNAEAVARCTEQGLDARVGDAVAELRAAEPGSVGAVTSFHVVEHLPTDVLLDLLDAAIVALRPGGLLLLETPNPENLVTANVVFRLDPTHLHPLPPMLLEFMARQRGFADIEIVRLHPTGNDLAVPATGAEDHRVVVLVDEINDRFHSAQDYALIARKPELSA